MTAGTWRRLNSLCKLGLGIATLSLVLAPAAQATFPGLPGQIVFESSPNGQILPDIYSVEPDGSGLKRLTTAVGNAGNAAPSVAPQGGDIVFERGERFARDIYLMESDGSNVRQITSLAGDETSPVFANDGERILFIHNAQIWSVDSDGSNLRILSNTPYSPVPESGLAVDPASDTVVYSTQPGTIQFLRAIDDDGTNDRPFFSQDGTPPNPPSPVAHNFLPDFAPSFTFLLTELHQPGGLPQAAVFKRPSGRELLDPPTDLTPAGPVAFATGTSFDPSGTQLVIAAGGLFKLNPAGGTPSPIFNDPSMEATHPSWEAVRTRCAGQDVTIGGTGRADVIRGTRRDDVIAAYDGDDKIVAKGGDDVVCAGADADVVLGGAGEDELHGRKGNDSLDGQADDDVLHGGAGNSDDCKEPHEQGHGCD